MAAAEDMRASTDARRTSTSTCSWDCTQHHETWGTHTQHIHSSSQPMSEVYIGEDDRWNAAQNGRRHEGYQRVVPRTCHSRFTVMVSSYEFCDGVADDGISSAPVSMGKGADWRDEWGTVALRNGCTSMAMAWRAKVNEDGGKGDGMASLGVSLDHVDTSWITIAAATRWYNEWRTELAWLWLVNHTHARNTQHAITQSRNPTHFKLNTQSLTHRHTHTTSCHTT